MSIINKDSDFSSIASESFSNLASSALSIGKKAIGDLAEESRLIGEKDLADIANDSKAILEIAGDELSEAVKNEAIDAGIKSASALINNALSNIEIEGAIPISKDSNSDGAIAEAGLGAATTALNSASLFFI